MTQTSLEQLQTQPIRQVRKVSHLLANENVKDRLKAIATDKLGADKYVQLSIEALRKTPKLEACDPMSFLNAMLQSCGLGLEPNTPLGHCYLIPFGKEVTLVIGYKGMADLARRHDDVVSIHSDVVYSDDETWSYQYGTDQHLHHRPGPRQGEPTHAYCYVKLKDGEAFSVLPWQLVLKTRDQSQGWQSAKKYGKTEKSPWHTHLDRMAAKTALRSLFNAGELPLSIEATKAAAIDDRPVSAAPMNQQAVPFDPLKFAEDNPDADKADVIEGTAEELEDPKPAEKKKPAAAKKKDEKSKEEQAEPEPKGEQKDMLDDKPSGKPGDRFEVMYDEMSGDLLDVSDPELVLSPRRDDVAAMEKERPDLHKRLMEEVAAMSGGGD